MITKCRSCGRSIIFLKTTKGKLMPVELFDIHGAEIDETKLFDPKEMLSHFANCPQSNLWRTKKKKV